MTFRIDNIFRYFISDKYFSIFLFSTPFLFFFEDCGGDPRVFNENYPVDLSSGSIFDGRGYSIIGLQMTVSDSISGTYSDGFGIVSSLGSGCTMINLEIRDSTININVNGKGVSNIGFHVGKSSGGATVKYCCSNNNSFVLPAGTFTYVGGVVGYMSDGIIEDLTTTNLKLVGSSPISYFGANVGYFICSSGNFIFSIFL